MTNIQKPIGLGTAVSAICNTCKHSDMFYRCGITPSHYIFNLDSGNGQTTLTEYIANMYYEAKVRRFGGLDLFLEYKLDGSMGQLKKMFANIESCAIYTNKFEGIVAIDISELANYINEAQVDYFLKGINETGTHATLILYVPSKQNKNTANLINKVTDSIENIEYIDIRPYTTREIVDVVKELLGKSGICIRDINEVEDKFGTFVLSEEIKDIKSAQALCMRLIRHADFSSFTPKLGLVEVNNYQESVKGSQEEVIHEKRTLGH